ncbi:MAG TPA: response regulator [Desulfomonilaceae bacterium]|nr:response regulator [Desulfomonilaceae bacterium]
MKKSILKGKEILAVDDDSDVLAILDEELEDYGVILDTATSYEEAMEKLASLTYDLAILDIMGVRGFDLLEVAVGRSIPVVILTAHSMDVASLKKSIELGARAYLPKHQLGDMAPFLEDVLLLSYRTAWKKMFQRLSGYFGQTFGPDWRKSEEDFWKKFDENLGLDESTIIEK